MTEEIKNYVLTYIDSENKEVIINSKGEEDTMEAKPFYISLKNAIKAKTKIQNDFNYQNTIDRKKSWYNKGMKLSKEERKDPSNSFMVESIKTYLDMLLIQKNGLIIREINISINLNKTIS